MQFHFTKKISRCISRGSYLFFLTAILHLLNVNNAQIIVSVCKDTQPFCPSLKALCSGLGSLCPLTCGHCTPTTTTDPPVGGATPETCDPVELGCIFGCVLNGGGVGKCACPAGLTLASDGKGCDDINECEVDNPCIEPGFTVCINNHGSFRCEDDSRCEFRQNFSYYYKRDGCCRSTTPGTCGKNIVTGNTGAAASGPDVVLGFWPWIAYVQVGRRICTGTLIDDRWVLIAAHCMGGYFRNGGPIVASVAKRSTKKGGNNFRTQDITIDVVKVHPNYDFPYNDIALMRLETSVEVNEFVRPVCLPHGEVPREELQCFFPGYESSFFQQGVIRNLVDAPVTVRNGSSCSGLSVVTDGVMDDHIMCLEFNKTQSEMCPGETGGPMVCQRCNSCDWFVAGIYSFGDSCSQKDSFAAFTGVEGYEDWIGGIIKERIVKDGPCQASTPAYRPWGKWSSCDQTCGRSSRSRTRTCVANGTERPSEDCHGHAEEVGPCPNRPCPRWGDFTQWSSCSRRCGGNGGTRTRTRSCINGIRGQIGCNVGSSLEIESCNREPCADWSSWSSWSDCMGTCGDNMLRTARRNCIRESSTQTCQGPSTKTSNCHLPRCPSWSDWSSWSRCLGSCGQGTSNRRRHCQNGNTCVGDTLEERICDNQRECPGQWRDWSQWSPCNATCGRGSITRSRVCEGGSCNGNAIQVHQCRIQNCVGWASWESWGACSYTCGKGFRTRRRNGCHGGAVGSSVCPGSRTEIEPCNNRECDGEEWSQWSDCSRLCGTGTRTRERYCAICASGKERHTGFCNQKDCARSGSCAFLRDQSMTTPSCTEIIPWCTRHPQFMRTNCQKTCCDAEVHETWSTWSTCSTTCGDGSQTRFRRCSLIDDCINPDLTQLQQLRRCVGPFCSSNTRIFTGNGEQEAPWGPWSSCIAPCGREGTRFRLRDCFGSECDPVSREVKTCANTDNCGGSWSTWSEASACDVTCGNGLAVRRRHCINGTLCPGPNINTVICKNAPCEGVCVMQHDKSGQDFCFEHQHLCDSELYILNCAYTCCRVANRHSICRNSWPEIVCANGSFLCANSLVKGLCQRTCNSCT